MKVIKADQFAHFFCLANSIEEKERVLKLFPNGACLGADGSKFISKFMEIPFVRQHSTVFSSLSFVPAASE